MSKKLEGNGLFESSRMMLPEHKEAFIVHQQNLLKKARPQIDEQEEERISQIITESLWYGKEVTLILFTNFNEAELRGTIIKMDHYQKKIQLAQEYDLVWINVADVIDAMF